MLRNNNLFCQQTAPDSNEPNDLEQPMLPGFLVHTIFRYYGATKSELKSVGSPFSINQIQTELNNYLDKQLPRLLLHVVRGEQKEVEVMLKKNPELLFMSGTVIDYSGRIIQGTAFQCALGALDDDMFELIVEYFDQLTDGKRKALRQFKQQFAEVKQDGSYDFTDIIKVISNDISGKSASTLLALEKFRNHFKPSGIITRGIHFNIQHLIDALQKFMKLPDMRYEQKAVFQFQVIGYLQRLLPACFAQRYCQGLGTGINRRVWRSSRLLDFNTLPTQKLKRSLKMTNTDLEYYPLDTDTETRLGFDCYLYGWSSQGMIFHINDKHLSETRRAALYLKEIGKHKLNSLIKLKENLEKDLSADEDQSRCLVM